MGKGEKKKQMQVAEESPEYKVLVSTVPISTEFIMKPMIIDDPSLVTCNTEFSLHRNKQARKSNHFQMLAETDRISYLASNLGKRSATTLPYKYAVAIIDTDQKTAQVFDAEYFVSERIIKKQLSISTTASDSLNSKDTPKEGGPSEYVKSRILLGESFGTRKTKKILNSYERNKINIDQLASQTGFISREIDTKVSKMSEMIVSNEPSLVEAIDEASSRILPTHDIAAKTAADIYKIQGLIPHDVYHSMDVDSLVNALKKKNAKLLTEAMLPFDFSDAVESRIRTLASMAELPEASSLDQLLRCLVYLSHLLHFLQLNESKLNGRLELFLPMASQEIVSALPQLYSECLMTANGKQRFKMSSLSKDRLIAIICILILTLDGFRTNVARLSATLQLSLPKTGDYLKAVGCILEKPEGNEPNKYTVPGTNRELLVKMATLKAPLKIIPPKSKKGPIRR